MVFVLACFAINLAFGPNNLIALTNGEQRGVGFAVIASLGRLIAFIPMIVVSALGMGLILSASGVVFTAIKLVGAAYLIYLGVKILRSSSQADGNMVERQALTLGQAFWHEGFVALGNPKAILVFAAFFPQFVVSEAYAQSYTIIGLIFLLLEAVAILIYALLGRLAARSVTLNLQWIQRASGIGMIVFGALLLLAQRPA